MDTTTGGDTQCAGGDETLSNELDGVEPVSTDANTPCVVPAGADTHVVYGSHTVTVTLKTVNQSKKKSSVDVDTIKRQIEGWGLKNPDKT